MRNFGDFLEGTEGAKTCPSCDGHNVTTTLEEQQFTYGAGEKAAELKVQVPVHHCADCDIDYTDGFAETLRHAAVCEHLGVMKPDEVSAIRKSYGLSRAEFARITKIGEASIARWETGALIQNGAYDQLLFLLTIPENFERLRKRTEETESRFDEGAQTIPSSQRFKVLSMEGSLERKRQESERFFLKRAG